MSRWLSAWALLLPLLSARAEIVVPDVTGAQLILQAPAQRIISLAPHLTELLFAAGAGAKLVGAVAYSDYPAQAQQAPRIGDSARFDIERIVALRPDLVLAWRSGNPSGEIDKLNQLGIHVWISEPDNLDAIAGQISSIGRLAGTSNIADAAAVRLRRDVAMLRHEYKGRRPISVFYQVWHEPLMTVNGKHVISEVIRLCGGNNIFADLPALVPTISLESVLAADPDAIVTGSEQSAAQALDDWRKWRQLRAVRNGNFLVIPSDDISRPTPRLLDGARRLCAALEQVRRSRPLSVTVP